MGRRGGSIYVNTDPANLTPVGIGGIGTSIGALGPTIYNANVPTVLSGAASATVAASASFQRIVYAFTGNGGTISSLALTFTDGWSDEQVIEIAYISAIASITMRGNVTGGPASAAAGSVSKFVWRGGNWVYFT
jgi:hypothetical protein